MQTLVKIDKKDNILLYNDLCDGFILGLKDFSVNYSDTFDINEIKEYMKLGKDIFVAINKNIFNDELDYLEKCLIELDQLKIKGVLFYDISLLYLKKKNNLALDLVWNQTHMVTNYNTCNYYYDKGVKYAFVSGEITLEEILEIKNKSHNKLMLDVVAHQVMSHSKRKLLTNFYNSIDKKYDGKIKTISERDEEYIVSEDKTGTVIKTKTMLNGIPIIPTLLDSDFDYIVVDESQIDKEIIIEALNLIRNIMNGYDIEKNIKRSCSLLGENTSFLFKKTIYKVKRGGSCE